MKKDLTSPNNVMSLLSRFFNWVASARGSTLIIGMLLVTINLIAMYLVRAYTSDDVVWQNALLTWVPFHDQIYYSDAGVSYLAKAPLYWLVSLIASGRPAILLTSIILAVANFYIIYRCYLYFLRISAVKVTRLTLLPLIWLASFGFALTQQFFSPNLHNIEIGCIFLLLVGASKLLRGEFNTLKKHNKYALFVVAALFIGLMVVNDRYFLYFGIVPALILAAIYFFKKMSSYKRLFIFGLSLFAGVIAYLAIKFVAEKAGVLFMTEGVAGANSPEVIGFDALQSNILVTIHSTLILFGADFFGRKALTVLAIVTIFNFVVLMFGIVWVVKLLRDFNKKRSTSPSIEMVVMAVTVLLALVVYTLSTLSFGTTVTYRYLMIMPYALCLILIFALHHSTARKFLAILLVAAILFNTFSSVAGIKRLNYVNEPFDATHYRLNQQDANYRFIDFIQSQGLTKGFGGYWNGNINSYLSKGKIQFLPVLCDANGNTERFKWLVDKSQFSKPAEKTFYIDDPFYPFPPMCSLESVQKQFGTPEKTLEFEGRKIYIYNYDIDTKLL